MKIAQPKKTSKLPEITGTPQQAQTLTEVHGTWENSPTGYTYKWQQCNSSGTACTVISGATAQTYVPVPGDVGHTIKVQRPRATKAARAARPRAPRRSSNRRHRWAACRRSRAPRSRARPSPRSTEPGKTAPPATPTSGSRCNGSGTACTVISGALPTQTYVPVAGDIGHTIQYEETASNEGGSGTQRPPARDRRRSRSQRREATKAPRKITGTAQQAQTLTEVHGTWEKQPDRLHLQVAAVRRLGQQLRFRPEPRPRPTCRSSGTSATRSESKRRRATKAARAVRPRAPRPS